MRIEIPVSNLIQFLYRVGHELRIIQPATTVAYLRALLFSKNKPGVPLTSPRRPESDDR